MAWDPALYDARQSYVALFGKSLIELVDISPGNRIWDLGCGTGSLTVELAREGADVTGTDLSPEMVEQARRNYPEITFLVEDATCANFSRPFDTIFSNAVFHWITDQEALLESIKRNLKPGGLLVCEMGAKGNIQAIENAFSKSLEKRNVPFQSIFTFPSLNEYVPLLDRTGFDVNYIREYDRPTPFEKGHEGLSHWIMQFYDKIMQSLNEETRSKIVSEMEEELRPILWKKDRWVGDYRRLQFIATRK